MSQLSEADEQKHFQNAMNKIPVHKRATARKAYNTARKSGQTHASALSNMHTMFSESEEVNELSVTALSNFKNAAETAAEKLLKQGDTSKNPANSYKKFRKAMKHLAGANDAETKIHKKKWADLTGT